MEFLQIINALIDYIGDSILAGLPYFLGFACIFSLLALIFPGKKSAPVVHKGQMPDIIYWFFGQPLFYIPATKIIFAIGVAVGLKDIMGVFYPHLSTLPVLLQAFLILLVMDILQYWTHRLFHTGHFWKFHAIHHAPQNVDWLTCVRFHPGNLLIHSTMVFVITYMAGFSPAAWLILAPFNMIYSPLVHANVNWTYGPFRYVLASPVFHRWHHTYEAEGGNKNFAPTFPFLDMLFGTYYDPKDKKPMVFGAENDSVPEDILGQLAYPFREIFGKKVLENGKV